MADDPTLSVRSPDVPVRAVALVLHGGRTRSTDRARPWDLSALRMIPFGTALLRAGGADGLLVAGLRYRVRGWNGSAMSPVGDARWALDQLASRFPGVPIGLVGHSMGGRAAMYVADHHAVRSVVGLAPWIEPGDRVEPLTGRRVLIAHGDRDRITDPGAAAAFAELARPLAEHVTYVTVRNGRHAMLRRARLWGDLAAGFTVGALLDLAPEGTGDAAGANVVRDALAGQPSLVV
jgi:pimeloyl-ACP methyl ester carboxylesterase